MTHVFRIWWSMCGERLKKRGFFEKRHAQNLQNVAEASLDLQFAFDDGDEHVDADGDPDLGLHRVVGVAVESFDPQILFDPFEEQFYFPAVLIKLGYGYGLQFKIVSQKDKSSFEL